MRLFSLPRHRELVVNFDMERLSLVLNKIEEK